jgi:hypothetical protein
MNWDGSNDPQEGQFAGEPVAFAAVTSRSVNEEKAAWDAERYYGCWEFQFPYFF